jgi:hypothetical protein
MRRRWIHAGVRRSLRMHGRLALGVALATAAADGIWLRASWPKLSANPEFIVFNSAVLLFLPVALGLMAAIAARNLDPRVYDSADVESVLGVTPFGDLPDFADVPSEYSEVDLLRLANEIAHACKKGRLRRCVITGTGHGTGVTTIAMRVKESLDVLDRPAVLVDATGARQVTDEPAAPEAAGRATAGPSGGDGARHDELIVTDAGPITASPDAEYLARFADCVLVVVGSGVTTRGELRRTATCLENLNVAAVRYVVNRAEQPRSGRHPSETEATPGAGPGPFDSAVRRALPHESVRNRDNSPARDSALDSRQAASVLKEPDAALAIRKRAAQESGQPSTWDAPGIPHWLADALSKLDREAAERSVDNEQMQGTKGADPELQEPAIEEAARHLKALPFEDRREAMESKSDEAEAMLFSMNRNASRQESDGEAGAANAPCESERTEKKPSRLSGLRGMVTAAELRALNQPKQAEATAVQPAVPSSLIDALAETPGRLTGLKGLVTAAELKELNQGRLQVAEAGGTGEKVEAKSRNAAESKLRIVEAAPGDRGAMAAGPAASEKMNAKSDAVPAKPPEPTRTGRSEPYGEVQILPSKRGQYGRK